jgi:tetratricopeptide (TPR) repeat protein
MVPLTLALLLVALVTGCPEHKDPLAEARWALSKAEYTKAIAALNALPPDQRGTYDVQLLFGRAYRGEKKYDESLEAFEKAAALKPNEPEPLLGSAETLLDRLSAAKTEAESARICVRGRRFCSDAVRIDAESAKAYALQARFERRLGNPDDALRLVRKAADLDSDYRMDLAREWLRRGQIDEAGTVVKEVLEVDPDDAVAHSMMARIHISQRDFDAARKAYRRALQLKGLTYDQKTDVIRHLMFLCAQDARRDPALKAEARERARELIKIDRRRGEPYMVLASLAIQDAEELADNPEKRQQKLQQAYQLLQPMQESEAPQILVKLAFVLEQLGRTDEALATYQRIYKIDPKHVYSIRRLAQLTLQRRMWKECKDYIDAGLVERPGDPMLVQLLIRLYRTRGGNPYFNLDKARAAFRRFPVAFRSKPEVLAEFAALDLETRRPRLALQRAEASIKKKDTAAARLVAGRAYLALHLANPGAPAKYLDKAAAELERAGELAPADPRVVLWQSRVYTAAKDEGRAVDVLQDYIARNPRQGPVYMALAAVYERQDPVKAITLLERAERVPGIAGFDHSALARSYFLLGDRTKAIEIWRQEGGQEQSLGVLVGLAVATALEGQHDLAVRYAEALANKGSSQQETGLIAACVVIQGGKFTQATRYLTERTRGRLRYASPKERTAYARFVAECQAAGRKGKQAAAAICEGLLHAEFGSTEVAVKKLDEAVKLLPNSIVPYYARGAVLLRGGRTEEYRLHYRSVARRFPGHGFPYYQLALLSMQREHSREAQEQLRLALDLDPKLTAAHIQMARLLIEEAREAPSPAILAKATKHASQAKELDGGTLASFEVCANAYNLTAVMYRRKALAATDADERRLLREKMTEAREHANGVIKELVDRYPNAIEAQKARVRYLMAEGQFSQAAGLAISKLRQMPDWRADTELRLMLARCLLEMGSEDAERYEAAREELESILAVDRRNVAAHLLLARVYSQMDQPEEVLATLARARRVLGGHAALTFEYARRLLQYNRPEAARVVYQRVFESIPANVRNATQRQVRAAAQMGVAQATMELPAQDKQELAENLREAAAMLKSLAEPGAGEAPNTRALVLLGNIHAKLGQDARALALLQQALKQAPNYRGAYDALSRLRYRRREYAEALTLHAETLVPKWPSDPTLRARQALLHVARRAGDDLQRAKEITQRVMTFVEGRASALANLELYCRSVRVVTLTAARQFAHARAEARRLRPLKSFAVRGYLQLLDDCARDPDKRRHLVEQQGAALFYEATGDGDRAAASVEELAKQFPENPYVLDQLVRMYVRHDRQAEFVAATERLIHVLEASRTPVKREEHHELYERLLDTYLSRAGNDASALEKALGLCERALRQWPKDLSFLHRQAMLYTRLRRPDDAKKTYELLEAEAPDHSRTWVGAKMELAAIAYRAGDAKTAARLYREIEPDIQQNAMALNNGAWYHAVMDPPDFPRAIDLAEKAKKLRPRDANIRDTLGWIYHLAKAYHRADPELEYAAQIRPDDPHVVYHYGVNLLELEQREKGLEMLLRARQLHGRGQRFEHAEACEKLIAKVRRELGGT